MDKVQLIEKAQRQLATRQVALQATLDEISALEAIQASGINLGDAVKVARIKRDRQNTACNASNQLIGALQGYIKKAGK